MQIRERQYKIILTSNEYYRIKADLTHCVPGYVYVVIPPDVGSITNAVYRFFDTSSKDLWLKNGTEFRILEAGRHLWLDLKVQQGGGDRYKIRIDVADRYRGADDFLPEEALNIILDSPNIDHETKIRARQLLHGRQFVEIVRFLKTTDRVHLARAGSERAVSKVFVDMVDFTPLETKAEPLILRKLDIQSEGFPPDLEALEEVTRYFEYKYGVNREPSGGPSTFEIVQHRLSAVAQV